MFETTPTNVVDKMILEFQFRDEGGKSKKKTRLRANNENGRGFNREANGQDEDVFADSPFSKKSGGSRESADHSSSEKKKSKAGYDNQFGEPDFDAILNGCAFVKHCAENHSTLSETHWHWLANLLSHLPDGRELFHELSRDYPGYSRQEADKKFDYKEAAGAGPMRCRTIAAEFGGCASCPHLEKASTPLQVGLGIKAKRLIEGVVKNFETDPGAPFTTTVRLALHFLDKNDVAEFARAMDALKRVGVSIQDLKRRLRESKHEFRNSTKQGRENAPQDGRPIIDVNEKQLITVIAETNAAVHKANGSDPKTFQCSGNLVRLRLRGHMHEIEVVSVDMAYGLIIRVARWVVKKATDLFEDVDPDIKIARDIIVNPDLNLPVLNGVIQVPMFGRKNGLIVEPGYHEDDMLYLDPSNCLRIDPIPENPTEEEVDTAKTVILDDLLGDFPFVSAMDKTHAVAMLILPFMRELIDGSVPMHGIEADVHGTGKTLLAKLVSILLTGIEPELRTLPTSKYYAEDEIKKMITAELIRGKRIIVIDNVNKPVDSSALASVLTAEIHTDRLLGFSQMVSSPNRALWIMTANNPVLKGELARRYFRIRIDANQDRPWLRAGFKHPNLLKWARENRAHLVRAILMLIQAWRAKGEPKMEVSFGSFEDWSEKMGGVCQVAKLPGFLGDLNLMYEANDDESIQWQEFCDMWWPIFKDKLVSVSEINLFCVKNSLLSVVRGEAGIGSQESRLGKALKRTAGRVYGKYRLVLAIDRGIHHGRQYRLELAIPKQTEFSL